VRVDRPPAVAGTCADVGPGDQLGVARLRQQQPLQLDMPSPSAMNTNVPKVLEHVWGRGGDKASEGADRCLQKIHRLERRAFNREHIRRP
jgi:hypothetical protein